MVGDVLTCLWSVLTQKRILRRKVVKEQLCGTHAHRFGSSSEGYTLWRYATARRLLVALRPFFLGRVPLGVRVGVSDLFEADRAVDEKYYGLAWKSGYFASIEHRPDFGLLVRTIRRTAADPSVCEHGKFKRWLHVFRDGSAQPCFWALSCALREPIRTRSLRPRCGPTSTFLTAPGPSSFPASLTTLPKTQGTRRSASASSSD